MLEKPDKKLLTRISSYNYLSLTTILRVFTEIVVQIVLAKNFGASRYVDAFYIALVLPNLILFVLTSSLRNIFIPTFTEERIKNGEASAWRVASSLCNTLILFLTIITIIGILTANIWIKYLAPGLMPFTMSLAAQLTRILLPIIVIGGAIITLDVVFYCYEQFRQPAIASMCRIIIYVAIVLIFTPILGIQATAFGIIFGYLINLILQILFLGNYRHSYYIGIDWKSPSFRKLLGFWFQLLLLSLLFRFSPLIDRHFASQLSEGSVSHLAYATSFLSLVGLLCSNNVALILFPAIANTVFTDDKKRLSSLAVRSICASAFITFPIFIIILTLGEQILRLLFQRGQFRPEDARVISTILIYASGAIIFPIITSTTANILYSLKKIKFLTLQAVAVLTIQVLVIILFFPALGIYALGLTASIISLTSATMHVAFLMKQKLIIPADGKMGLINLLRQAGCALGMAIICHSGNIILNQMKLDTLTLFLGLSFSIVLGVGVYWVFSIVLHVEEIRQVNFKLYLKSFTKI